MRDFFIKLLGGYKVVVTVIDRRPEDTTIDSIMANIYPFRQTAIRTRGGTVYFDKNNKTSFEEEI